MNFKIKPSCDEFSWHRWFAWKPVIINNRFYFCEYIERKAISESPCKWLYRLPTADSDRLHLKHQLLQCRHNHDNGVNYTYMGNIKTRPGQWRYCSICKDVQVVNTTINGKDTGSKWTSL